MLVPLYLHTNKPTSTAQFQTFILPALSSTHPPVLNPRPSTDSSLRGSLVNNDLDPVLADSHNYTYQHDNLTLGSNSTWSAPRSLPPPMTIEELCALQNAPAQRNNTAYCEPGSTNYSFHTQSPIQQTGLKQTFSVGNTQRILRSPIPPPAAGGDRNAPSLLTKKPARKSR